MNKRAGSTFSRAQFAPLAASSFAAQIARDPAAFASKVSTRLTGRPLRLWGSAGEQLPGDFAVPIYKSDYGGFKGTVLHVLTNSLPHSTGGYAIRSHEILKAQAEIGLSPSAITRLGYPVSVGKMPAGAFELVDAIQYARVLPTFYPLRFAKQVRLYADCIAREAEERGASVLHTTTPWPNAAATSLAAAKLGIPWVYEVRGEPEATWAAYQPAESQPEQSAYFHAARAKEEEAMRAAAAVVVLSQTSKEAIQARGVHGRIVVVPNAIDAGSPAKRIDQEEARHVLKLPQRRYVGAVSSVVEYEGFDTLIRSLHRLPRDVAVLLVGDGTYLPALKRLAATERLADRVVFAGRQPTTQIAPWYCALDVFVSPRVDTPVTRTVTPMKTLQAHAFGIPVVASDLPALREVTRQKAFYFTPGDPAALAQAIRMALAAPRKAVPSLPTWADAACTYSELYASL